MNAAAESSNRGGLLLLLLLLIEKYPYNNKAILNRLSGFVKTNLLVLEFN